MDLDAHLLSTTEGETAEGISSIKLQKYVVLEIDDAIRLPSFLSYWYGPWPLIGLKSMGFGGLLEWKG